jgi:predicted permease
MKKYNLIILCIIIFLIFLWIQSSDKKNKNKNKNENKVKIFIDKIKNPLLVISLILFVFSLNKDNNSSKNNIIEDTKPNKLDFENITDPLNNQISINQDVFIGQPNF